MARQRPTGRTEARSPSRKLRGNLNLARKDGDRPWNPPRTGLSSGQRTPLATAHPECSPIEPLARAAHLLPWIERVGNAVAATNAAYPFLAYGTDWLAFAHLLIAIAFIGPLLDPVRNKWVIAFGLIACAGVIPLALIAGQVRGVPLGWRLIDCSFGVLGGVPLLLCHRCVGALETRMD
jgi:hypothetical protein